MTPERAQGANQKAIEEVLNNSLPEVGSTTDEEQERALSRQFKERFGQPDGSPVTTGHQIANYETTEQELDQGE